MLKNKKLKGHKFDRATLFRNLKTLVEKNILNTTEFGTGAAFYCLNSDHHHHHHVFCIRCETAKPLPVCAIAPHRTLGNQCLCAFYALNLTSGLVAHIYGLRYMGTLYGFVFLSHQLGSFLGVWLGGRMYDLTGDYTMVWWIGVGVGAFSAIIHLPIRERQMVPLAA